MKKFLEAKKALADKFLSSSVTTDEEKAYESGVTVGVAFAVGTWLVYKASSHFYQKLSDMVKDNCPK